jgi:predicted kinase
MKIKHLWNLLKEGSTQEEQFGKNLIASGWTIKINYYIPLIKIKNPEGKETEIDGNDADKILSKIKMGQDEKTWVLGYLHKTNALNEHTLTEGVYDKGILKAIFLIGRPGSGKSYVINQLFGISSKTTFSRHGLKLVNPDPVFEKLLRQASINPSDLDSISKEDPERYSKVIDPIRTRAKEVETEIEKNYISGRIGMVLEGTGKNVTSIKNLKNRLEDIGYDCMMIYVNTDLETAKKRNQMRDRTIPEDLLVSMWNNSQKNLGDLQRLFGPMNTLIIDNSNNSKIGSDISKAIERFMQKPVTNPAGKMWIKQELMKKSRK